MVYALLVGVAVALVLLPLLLLVVTGLVNRWPWPEVIPSAWSLRGIRRLFAGGQNVGAVAAGSIRLSLVVAGCATAIATLAARAICLGEGGKTRWVERLTLLPLVVPATAFGMGSHMLFIRLGLNNTPFAVVLSHLICALPFSVRMMVDVTTAARGRLEEQAMVLGAGRFRAFLHGSLPALAPGMVSAAAVAFMISYTQYFLTMLIGGGKVQTLAVVVMPLISGADRTISSVYSLLFILLGWMVFLLFQILSTCLSRVGGQTTGGGGE